MTATNAGNGPAILVEDLYKSFGPVEALRGVDLSVERGTVLGVLGPNGAGKTTAVKVLTTLLAPTKGRALVEGFDVVHQADAVRQVIGLAGQSAAIQEDLPGRANLELLGRLFHLSKKQSRERAEELLARFDLLDAAGRPRPTPAACSGASTWLRAWWPSRPCCSSTSPPPASTPGPASACGTSSGTWSPPGPRCCSPPSTSTRPTSWPTRSWSSTTGGSSPPARPRRSRTGSAVTWSSSPSPTGPACPTRPTPSGT